LPELRIDPLSGLRVIVAGERVDRPGGGITAPAARVALDPETDPFLEGHEGRTPPELHASRPAGGPANGPGWTVRVVPNLYPALTGSPAATSIPADPLADGRGEPELFVSREAHGAHELIVNSPRPAGSLLELSVDELTLAMEAWGDRIRVHPSAPYVHVLVNEGAEAGASLPHTHAQLYALPFVPAAVARERERFTAYAERTQGRNLLEDLIQSEVKLGRRLVGVDRDAVAICPFASRSPFELQIVPRAPRARFEDPGALGAGLLHEVLGRLESALGALPPLNLWVRTAPRGATHWCWRIDVVPRLTRLAGLELGTGIHMNVLPPERAAAVLRGDETLG